MGMTYEEVFCNLKRDGLIRRLRGERGLEN